MQDSTGSGKGDTPRPVNRQTYSVNFDRIFKKGKRLPRIGAPHPCNRCSSSVTNVLKKMEDDNGGKGENE